MFVIDYHWGGDPDSEGGKWHHWPAGAAAFVDATVWPKVEVPGAERHDNVDMIRTDSVMYFNGEEVGRQQTFAHICRDCGAI